MSTIKGENLVLAYTPHLYPNNTLGSWISKDLTFSWNVNITMMSCLMVLINFFAMPLHHGHCGVVY
jgi:hypothetical protein